ncbi:Hypothetical protein CINCED_3A015819 [Cinara cedri]|uniref:Uncharacterized protein n=1 Tax=Cinara cedri TaxID=506608 RepID=A0A5E4NEX2_9HEMI|nr:Hypothetical protein CINCED_3A015819 [Cinara cedri]
MSAIRRKEQAVTLRILQEHIARSESSVWTEWLIPDIWRSTGCGCGMWQRSIRPRSRPTMSVSATTFTGSGGSLNQRTPWNGYITIPFFPKPSDC